MELHGPEDIVDPGGEFKKGGAQRRRDCQTATIIYSAMPMDLMQHLISKETAKDVWETIRTLQLGHERVREASLQTMMKNYENLQMGDDESVEQFAARVVPLVNGIRTLGEEIEEISPWLIEFARSVRRSRRSRSCGVSFEQRLHNTYP